MRVGTAQRGMLSMGMTMGLLLVWGIAAAQIISYRDAAGRLVFTNVGVERRLPSVRKQTKRQKVSARASLLQLIRHVAQHYGVEPRLVQAIVAVESNFDPYAVSPAGAQGLMQLMPATAAQYQVTDPFDPYANVAGGVRYLKDLLQRFAGDVRQAVAAYHAGTSAVVRFKGVPPYPDTQRYVARVLARYGTERNRQKIYRYRLASGSILFTDIPRLDAEIVMLSRQRLAISDHSTGQYGR